MESWTFEQARRYLMEMEHPGVSDAGHRYWVESSTPRFLRTLELLPGGTPGQRCLEVGAMPYTFTLLLQKLTPYSLDLVDYFQGAVSGSAEARTVRLPALAEEHRFVSRLCDLELEPLPFEAETFDGALCCEVLEHVTRDPVAMLAEIHRALRPDAWLMLTTPNVARFRSILALLHGRNVYDPYSVAFGPTWRHNREYTAREVADLLAATGFAVERLVVEDADPPFVSSSWPERVLRRAWEAFYGVDYGGQIYALARRGPARREYPTWLFQHGELDAEAARAARRA